jgi:ParB-like chromosome segregation protein Spo0J
MPWMKTRQAGKKSHTVNVSNLVGRWDAMNPFEKEQAAGSDQRPVKTESGADSTNASIACQFEIDPEFRDLLPPPSAEALAALKESLLSEGCRESLVVWQHDGEPVLIDGHTRHRICTELGIPFKTTIKDLPDRDAVVDWILRTQLGRRNLSPEEFTLILGRRYSRLKSQGARTDLTFRQSDGKLNAQKQTRNDDDLIEAAARTADALAKEYGISARTVERAGQLVEAIKAVAKSTPNIEQQLIDGEVSRRQVLGMAKPPAAPKAKEPPNDGDGRPIPAHLRDVFAKAEQFREFAQILSTMKGQVKQAVEADGVAWSQFSENEFRSLASRMHDLFSLSGPFIICSYCGGDHSASCTACKGAGFLSKAQARCVPKELRP